MRYCEHFLFCDFERSWYREDKSNSENLRRTTRDFNQSSRARSKKYESWKTSAHKIFALWRRRWQCRIRHNHGVFGGNCGSSYYHLQCRAVRFDSVIDQWSCCQDALGRCKNISYLELNFRFSIYASDVSPEMSLFFCLKIDQIFQFKMS